MVVLSASILTRNGKVLLARQFIEISRIRLEGLLNAFPKLLMSESRQHTFIDTENVRYVYQPMENYVLLLITNKSSNLVEDLHTQHILSKMIVEICGPITEENITMKQFEIIFAFDEIISPGGYADTLSIAQVKTNLEMESHEEKLYQMIQESKQSAAKDEMKRQQMRIRDEQKEKMKFERMNPGGLNSSANSLKMYPGANVNSISSTPSYQQPPPVQSQPLSAVASSSIGGSGMKLGGVTKALNLMDAMVAEDNITKLPPSIINGIPDANALSETSNAAIPAVHVSHEPVVTSIEEKISVSINREGAIQSLEIKGSLFISANDQSIGPCGIRLSGVSTGGSNGFTYQTHPKINKKLFETESTLALKDTSKIFPEARVGVLRWGLKTTDESFLPLNITCWPEEETGGTYNVNIEYTLEKINMTFENVDVIIPLHGSEGNIPKIIDIDGTYTHNPQSQVLVWHIERISKENKNGTLEFTIHSTGNADGFFPLNVSFYSQQVYTEMHVDNVYALENGTSIAFGFDRLFTVDSYVIQ